MDLLSQITKLYALTILNMGNLPVLHQFQPCMFMNIEKALEPSPKKVGQ